MRERSQNSYPLLREFREFYAEVARLRQMIAEARVADEPASGWNASGVEAALPEASQAAELSLAVATAADATTSRVWYEMTSFLDRKMYEVKSAANSASNDTLHQLVYIMAAYADETYVCLIEWSGKDYWRDNLMELRLFHSQIAGQDIFRRIDRLLARQDYGTEELAAVYLMILALGFKGQYQRDPGSIEIYRRKLFDRLLLTNPDLKWNGRRIFPEAYRHTVTEGAPVMLPEPKKWWGVVAAIVGGWLILSTLTWLVLVNPTRRNLAIARHALDIVTNQGSSSDVSTKWRALPFPLQGGAFQLALPSALPMNQARPGSIEARVAPLLIAVDGPGGPDAVSRLHGWLSSGLTSFQRNPYGAVPQAKSIASVEQVSAPNGVMAATGTVFFLIDPGLNAQDLTLHPLLTFPINDKVGATSVTLYFSDRITAVTQ
jgi:type VI secretion system protein ImpK